MGALLQSLRLEQPALGLQFLESLDEFVPYRFARLFQRRTRRHIVAVRKDADIVEVGDLLAGQRVEFGDLLDLVAEEADAPRHIFIVRREEDRKSTRLNSSH